MSAFIPFRKSFQWALMGACALGLSSCCGFTPTGYTNNIYGKPCQIMVGINKRKLLERQAQEKQANETSPKQIKSCRAMLRKETNDISRRILQADISRPPKEYKNIMPPAITHKARRLSKPDTAGFEKIALPPTPETFPHSVPEKIMSSPMPLQGTSLDWDSIAIDLIDKIKFAFEPLMDEMYLKDVSYKATHEEQLFDAALRRALNAQNMKTVSTPAAQIYNIGYKLGLDKEGMSKVTVSLTSGNGSTLSEKTHQYKPMPTPQP